MRGSLFSYRVYRDPRSSLPAGLDLKWPSLVLALFVLSLVGGWVSPTAAAPLVSSVRPPQNIAYLANNTSIIADFDNDNQPDLAIIRSEGSSYKIEIQLSSRQESVFYTVPNHVSEISLIVCDIDGDEDDDLIIVNGASLQPLGVWINNDGRGRFEKGKDRPSCNFLWSDRRSGYRHSERETPTFVSPINRWSLDGATRVPLETGWEPEGRMTNARPQAIQPMPSHPRQSRSPPRAPRGPS